MKNTATKKKKKTYQVDDKVRYENAAYKAKVNIDIPEEWNPEKNGT